ncbi:drug:proton antiporter [Marinomonas ostreistagni]|uniref:Drug:proton antiporter n=1 Tax=Marinomonas ostreistagni TaxID=359209 RepID=A0ABS0ZB65_9GAMM|nr:drug:proton antiporter [Marinomonas ostreistagni]MBJ7550880.1 drug:proton antiporter [Marinomonas ostreistagni]
MILNGFVLYVASLSKSVTLYSELLEQPPIRQSDDFALFVTPNGQSLRLWQQDKVIPSTNGVVGGVEVVLHVDSLDELNTQWLRWQSLDLQPIQPIETLSFGETFTMIDHDGHRLRLIRLSV